MTSTVAEFSIMDEGGDLHPAFIPFILRHREQRHAENFLDFYRFSGESKPHSNNGTGTSFMHTYVDKVLYYKSENGGLVVHLKKENKNQ